MIGEIIDYGVNNIATGVQSQQCLNDANNAVCLPTNPMIPPVLSQAVGSDSYSFTFTYHSLWVDSSA